MQPDPGRHLPAIVEGIEDLAVVLTAPTGAIATWNAGARALTGLDAAEAIGRHVGWLWADGDPNAALAAAARDGRVEEDTWVRTAAGHRRRAQITVTSLPGDGAPQGFSVVVRRLDVAGDEVERLRLAVGTISDYGIFLLDTDGRVATWNEGARRLKGYEAPEIVGEHFSRFYTEDDLARDYPAHELAVATREGRFEDEGWRVRKDGSRFWANVVITALRDPGGELQGFVKVTRDLSARRRAEQDLRARTAALTEANRDLERLRTAVTTIRDYAIFLLDPEGRVATWNEGARRIKGYEASEIVGEHFSRFYTEDDLATGFPARELETAARVGRFEDEGWRVRKDGSRFWANVVITAVRGESGELVGFSKVTRDLTDRWRGEEELRRKAEELRAANHEIGSLRLAIATIADYAIFLLDPDGRVATWNEGARRLKGYEATEIIGEHFSRFYTEEHLARDFPAYELEIAARAGRFEDEGWRVRKDGSRFWANVVITAVRDEAGTLVGFAKVTRDLTQRRQAEEALRATAEDLARANAELERFAAAAAHDLVQPLHTIVGLVDLVRERTGDQFDTRTTQALAEIRASGLRLSDRVDALLRYARSTSEELELRPLRLDDVLDHVERTLRAPIAERGAVLARDGVDVSVEADAALLEVVLQNLVENALKFNEGAPLIEIGSTLEGDRRRIWVADNGIGVDAHDRDRIFQLFARAASEGDYAGTGMGLALCRQIVERHGGEIGVDDAPGGGSRFWFTLPAAGRPAGP